MNLSHKVAIVTGSSKGIGMHIAKSLADAGASVVVNSVPASSIKAQSLLAADIRFKAPLNES